MDIVFLFLKLILGMAVAYLAVVIVSFAYFLWRKEPKTLSAIFSLLWLVPLGFMVNDWWHRRQDKRKQPGKDKKILF